jgi:hypothetical protein
MDRITYTGTVLAIDPGPEQSAYVTFDAGRILHRAKVDNQDLYGRLLFHEWGNLTPSTVLVIEQVAAMGMAVGAEVFETVFWSGKFAAAWQSFGGRYERMKRHEVKMFWCNSTRAKDGNIRQAIIDRYGGKEKAIGKKATPGPLYGVSKDVWQALALAICWHDQNQHSLTRGA